MFQSADDSILSIVSELRAAYEPLVNSPQEPRSGAQMLIMVLDGLFKHTLKEYERAMAILTKLVTPKSWNKVDVVREAGALQVSSFSEIGKESFHSLALTLFITFIVSC